jgi:pentatricopeptide repeat protein
MAPMENQENLLPSLLNDPRRINYASNMPNRVFAENEHLEMLSQGDLNDVDLEQILHILRSASVSRNHKDAKSAFDLIGKCELEATVECYNLLIKVYSRTKDLESVQKVFRKLQSSKIVPDDETYILVFDAYIEAGDLDTASSLEKQWRTSGVLLPQQIYSNLIQALMHRKDFRRVFIPNSNIKAQKIYDFVQAQIGPPELHLMNNILHLCAVTNQPERALDLFQEMNDGAAIPNEVTYTKLISACGSREDYYLDAFRIFETMVAQGFTPSFTTLNELLNIAGKHGDLPRAQLVWNDMTERFLISGFGSPSPASAALMMRVLYRLLKLRRENDLKADIPENTVVESDRLLDMVADSDGKAFIFSGVGCHRDSLLPLADDFYAYCTARGMNSKILVDAYFAVYANAGPNHTEQALQLFTKLYTAESSVRPDGRGYILLLKSLTKNETLMREHGDRVWTDFVAWDNAQEAELVGPTASDPSEDTSRIARQLSPRELEYRRGLAFRGREFVSQAFRFVGQY